MTDRRVPLACCAVGLLLIASACSTGGAGQPTKTVVVTHIATAPATTPAGTAPSSAPSSTTPSPTATTMRALPGTCDNLLPAAAIDTALGRSIGGRIAFVVGLPEKNIGRLAYLNCRYGLPAGRAGSAAGTVAKAEIGVSLYKDQQSAAARIPATVDDYVSHGANSSTMQVDGQAATLLTGGTGAGYDEPTLVLTSGQRTVAVSVHESPGAQATKDLGALANLALTHTGG